MVSIQERLPKRVVQFLVRLGLLTFIFATVYMISRTTRGGDVEVKQRPKVKVNQSPPVGHNVPSTVLDDFPLKPVVDDTAPGGIGTTSQLAKIPSPKRRPQQVAVVVIACNRVTVSKALDSIFDQRPSEQFAIIVSQDCDHKETSDMISNYGGKVLHLKQPDQSPPAVQQGHEEYINYYRISRHYKWIMTQVFDVLKFEQAILIEDDMVVAPDFFDYFAAMLPVLQNDDSLLCVSAWNDNGKAGRVEDSRIHYKSDFFPGLGWMLLKSFWTEIKPIWPTTFWDDWLRHPQRHKGRGCIRPEVSRTFNFGKQGVSGGQYYEEHIGKIVLSQEKVQFSGFDHLTLDLVPYNQQPYGVMPKDVKDMQVLDVRQYLQPNYDVQFKKQVYDLSTVITSEKLLELVKASDMSTFQEYVKNNNLVGIATDDTTIFKDPTEFDNVNSVHYCGKRCRRRFRINYTRHQSNSINVIIQEQVEVLRQWELMRDIREDCARTSYRGVVTFKVKLITPQLIYPVVFDGTGDEMEEYVQVFIAPDTPMW